MPQDFRVSITNAPGKGVYPISSFTWLLFYENPKDKQRAKIMVDFMKWALTDGQKFAPELGYAPLPAGSRRPRDGSPQDDQALAGRGASAMTKTPSSRRSADDRGFRLGTGFFALLVVLLVAGIVFELYRTSHLSIAKFGFPFWTDEDLGPRLRRVRRAAVHLGHALLVAPRACSSRRRSRSASRSSSRSSRPSSLRTPLAFLTELLAAIPSIVYGLWGIFVLVPLVRKLEVAHARLAAEDPALLRAAARRRDARPRPSSSRSWSFRSRPRSRARC